MADHISSDISSKTPEVKSETGRKERLARRLRENLKRRKAQARARSASDGGKRS